MFTLASAACGARRYPDGARGGTLWPRASARPLVMPSVLSIINVTYSGEDLPRALGIYGLVMGLAAACGQLIGGGLIQADIAGSGWRACFLINVPVGIAALALTPRFVPESRSERRPRLDLIGTLLLTAGLTAVVLPLVQGRQHGWPAWTWISFGVAPLLLLGFAFISAVSPAAAASRCCRRRCSAPDRSPPGCSRNSRSGADRRRSSSCSRCTCSRAAG